MKNFSSPSQILGRIGEDLACSFLIKAGFSIVERNYTRKWGEIDIVATSKGVTHFVEVKSVSCENIGRVLSSEGDVYRPEDQVDRRKLLRISRTIESYLSERAVGEWVFDVVCVYLDLKRRCARVKILPDVII